MVFSQNGTPGRSMALSHHISTPVIVTRKNAQTLVNRSYQDSGSDGLISYNWSTANIDTGWYSAVAFANRTLYLNGVDNYSFQIIADVTPPNVTTVSPTGWNNTQNVTFTYPDAIAGIPSGGSDTSITLDPDLNVGGVYSLHNLTPSGLSFSPGHRIDGTPFP